MEQKEGFTVSINEEKYCRTGDLYLEGTFSAFINPGSQYAFWYRFPDNFVYQIKDLDSGEVYESMEPITSISHSGNEIYHEYAQLPCNKIVVKEFSVRLEEIPFFNGPEEEIVNFEIVIHYMSFDSEPLTVLDYPIKLDL